jgi:hypothetical protein
LHLYLPSWRWVYAVLRAAYHGERALCRGRRIPLPELQSAVRKYTAALRRGEADDLDPEAPEAELELQAPAALSTCRLPSAEATGEADLEAWSEAEVLPDPAPAAKRMRPPGLKESGVEEGASSAGPGPSSSAGSSAAAAVQEARGPPAAVVVAALSGNAAPRVLRKPVARGAEALSAAQRDRERERQLREALRRSRIRCTCGLPLHADRCRLWSPQRLLLWRGCDVGVTREDLRWLADRELQRRQRASGSGGQHR